MMNDKINEKIKRISKGKIVTRFWYLFLSLSFFFLFSGIVFITLYFVQSEYKFIFLCLTIICFFLGLVFIILTFYKKTYSKSTIDELNKKLINDAFNTSRFEDRSKSIRKNLFYNLKIENITINSIEGALYLEIVNNPCLLIDIKSSDFNIKDEKINSVKISYNNCPSFTGTAIFIDGFNLDIENRIEVREIKSPISKSCFYSDDYKLTISGFSEYFNVYSDNLEMTNKILNSEMIKLIKNLKNEFIAGICVVFLKKSIILELYNCHLNTSLISYNDIYPGKSYFAKKESFNQIYSIISELINVLIKK